MSRHNGSRRNGSRRSGSRRNGKKTKWDDTVLLAVNDEQFGIYFRPGNETEFN